MCQLRKQLALAATSSVLLLTCSDAPPRMEVVGVSPNRVRERVITIATVEGRNFRNEARAALDDRRAEIDRSWHFTVPDFDTVPYEATYLDSETVRIVLPASLPLGPHDLELTSPNGDSDTLEDAFTVEPPDTGGAAGAGGAVTGLATAGSGGVDNPGGAAGDTGATGDAGAGGAAGNAGAAGAAGRAGAAGAASDAGAAGMAVAEPSPFVELNTVNLFSDPTAFNDDPSFTDDLLELYFSVDRTEGPGVSDIWSTRRDTVTDAWEPASRDPDLSGPNDDAFPGVSGDGLTLWFCSDRPAAGSLGLHDIWVSTRTDRSAQWSPPEHVPELSSPATDCAPQVSPSGLLMMISSDRPGGMGMRDLYWADRASVDETWSTPRPIPVVNSPADDSEGRLMGDGLRLYFSSNRDGAADYDLYAAMRYSTSEDFGTPVALDSLNSAGVDRDPWLSPDLRYIMFTSDRDGTTRIYEAFR